MLLWDCASNCDYNCQRIITTQRQKRRPPIDNAVVQFHGKWPFHRLAGIQEPFSVLFSLLNFLAHQQGLAKVREQIPKSYPLRPYYELLAYFGLSSWVFSMLFHVRDFPVTETLDYLAAGAYILYGLYYGVVRMFGLDQASGLKQGREEGSGGRGAAGAAGAAALRAWTGFCALLYLGHVSYLLLVRWDHEYNILANLVVGMVQNVLWTWFSVKRYRAVGGQGWTVWPALIVGWIIAAMSLELFDFAPLGGMLDAHSLWHLGTVGPTVWWYRYVPLPLLLLLLLLHACKMRRLWGRAVQGLLDGCLG